MTPQLIKKEALRMYRFIGNTDISTIFDFIITETEKNIKANMQSKGGKARWYGVPKEARSKMMRELELKKRKK